MKLKSFILSCLVLTSLYTSPQVLAESHTSTKAPITQPIQDIKQVHLNQTVTSKININTATATEIQHGLIGIGMKKAEAIIQYRETHGPFTMLEQLLEVQGIGQATLEKNRERMLL